MAGEKVTRRQKNITRLVRENKKRVQNKLSSAKRKKKVK